MGRGNLLELDLGPVQSKRLVAVLLVVVRFLNRPSTEFIQREVGPCELKVFVRRDRRVCLTPLVGKSAGPNLEVVHREVDDVDEGEAEAAGGLSPGFDAVSSDRELLPPSRSVYALERSLDGPPEDELGGAVGFLGRGLDVAEGEEAEEVDLANLRLHVEARGRLGIDVQPRRGFRLVPERAEADEVVDFAVIGLDVEGAIGVDGRLADLSPVEPHPGFLHVQRGNVAEVDFCLFRRIVADGVDLVARTAGFRHEACPQRAVSRNLPLAVDCGSEF